MKDETIIRMLQETGEVLSQMAQKPFPQECRYLQHSFDALLQAARANHPNDAFLSALPTLGAAEQRRDEELGEDRTPFSPHGPHGPHGKPKPPRHREAVEASPHELQVLFAQLRIALESLQDETAGSGGAGSDDSPVALPAPIATSGVTPG